MTLRFVHHGWRDSAVLIREEAIDIKPKVCADSRNRVVVQLLASKRNIAHGVETAVPSLYRLKIDDL